jgi:transposase-like protein
MFATAAPIQLRSDVTAADLRLHARRTRDPSQARRLLALAEIYDGGRRSEAARIGGVTLQIVRDWVVQFNATRTGRPHRPQSAGPCIEAERGSAARALSIGGERPDPSHSRRGAVAVEGPCPVDLGGVPYQRERDDAEPGAEGAGLCQAVGAVALLCPERTGDGGV